MSTSNLKSNSLASKRKPTKRYDATKGAKKPQKSSLKSAPKRQTRKDSSNTLGSRSGLNASSRKGSSSIKNAFTSTSTKPRVNSQPKLKQNSQPSNKAQGASSSPSTTGRKIAVGIGALAAVTLVGVVVLLVLSHMPVFVIEGIDASATEHVSAEQIAKLANVEEGTTLLNMDVNAISDNLKRNPWIKDVSLNREFPSTLGITVTERNVGALVVIGAGASVWSIGTDGVWIEPVTLDTSGTDTASAALARAQELGCLLITDVPSSVDPAQGSPTTDDTINAVFSFQDGLPDDIASQARVYYASSEGSISVVLNTGLEISLGSPEDINAKSQALSEIMANYPNQLTYINVRVASKPTYRKVPDGTTIASVTDIVASNVAETATDESTSTDEEQASADDGSGDVSGDEEGTDGSDGSSGDSE